MTNEQKSFIERVGKLAAADMQESGVLASLTIAQAILESGWGKSGRRSRRTPFSESRPGHRGKAGFTAQKRKSVTTARPLRP